MDHYGRVELMMQKFNHSTMPVDQRISEMSDEIDYIKHWYRENEDHPRSNIVGKFLKGLERLKSGNYVKGNALGEEIDSLLREVDEAFDLKEEDEMEEASGTYGITKRDEEEFYEEVQRIVKEEVYCLLSEDFE